MFCPSCGRSIPDGSKFCLYCGARIPESNDQLTMRETPPVSLEIHGLWEVGPFEVKKGLLSTKIGRGIKFAFSLLDSEGKQTASDGEVIALLKSEGYDIGYATHKAYRANIQEALLRSRASDTLWSKRFGVKRSDFKWVTYTYIISGKETRELAYEYAQTSPLLFFGQGLYVELHVWFVTPDQRCLYRPSTTFTKWGSK